MATRSSITIVFCACKSQGIYCRSWDAKLNVTVPATVHCSGSLTYRICTIGFTVRLNLPSLQTEMHAFLLSPTFKRLMLMKCDTSKSYASVFSSFLKLLVNRCFKV